ncbi:protein serine/threonine phosphatase 2C [Guyanagaster necrorhizus]|uniref:Protein serine/threonine phosphatase 2C n=1 Tax=Guyanagaster necrorhizus TaxID=856835 RepID=A0A9P8AVU8_9AGAR|nr:protein serine/threonine phosphatase 2C [Guyanagaster necrorhizus MCA 3950]KAG7449481.1 protein serine/threonine phosphatase 2C [Guyanagaster necrorhizus MCA 3950]
MWRRAWKPAAATIAIGTPACLYYYRSTPTFSIPIRVKDVDGKPTMSTKVLPLLSMEEVNKRLNARANAETIIRHDGIVWNYANAALPSNDPIEDAHSKQIIQRDDASGDYLFFTVMDGHRAGDTSHLLSLVLIKAVSLALSKLISNSPSTFLTESTVGRVKSMVGFWSAPDADPHRVSVAIQDAFTDLDRELITAPLRVLAGNIDGSKVIPDLSKHPLALKTMLPAISGSCALMAIFDTAHKDLYVACTGDSRAVAGVWEPTPDGKGHWRVDVLSEDQTGRNPNELKRMQAEHPKDEADTVIRNGRVLGGLEPTRAFGDARYKWTREVHDALNRSFMVGNDMTLRTQPQTLKTPPYVTARPEVTHRKLSFDKSSPGAIRFLVLATDGLWDEITSEEVVSLVGGHLAGVRGVIPKAELPSLVPTFVKTGSVEGKDHRRKRNRGSWAFCDDNVGTHLIRNALGGGDEESLRQLVSIPAPYSRRHRDDITVTVVWWEEGREEDAQVTTPTKAKL